MNLQISYLTKTGLTLLAMLFYGISTAQTTETDTITKTKVIDGKKVRITIKTEKKVIDKDGKSEVIVSEDTIKLSEDMENAVVEAMDAIDEIDSMVKEERKEVRKDVIIEEKLGLNKHRNHTNESQWFNFDFGFNFLVSDGQLDMPDAYKDLELDNGKGCNFNLRVYEQSLSLVKNRLYLIYGVGFDWNNYRFKNNVDLFRDSTPLAWKMSDQDYKKNKLVSTYLTVPVMLQVKLFEDSDGDAFNLAVGPQFGYLLSSHQKQKWEKDGDQKRKVYGDFNLTEFRVGYAAYFGYKGVDFYVRYYPESAFKKDKGPNANTMAMGLAFGIPE